MAAINGTTLADQLTGTAESDQINGGAGNDVILAGEGNDTVTGGAGNDQLYGGAGDDGFYGSGGTDIIYGEAGNDVLFGEGGNDVLYGGSDDDILLGGTGDDALDGGTGSNTVNGDGGNDTLTKNVGLGIDTFDGGTGIDTVYLELTSEQLTPGVLVDLNQLYSWQQDNLAAAGGDENVLGATADGPSLTLNELGLTVANVERVTVLLDGQETDLAAVIGVGPSVVVEEIPVVLEEPPAFDYVINGTDGDDDLTGTALNDQILAGAGKDFVAAGDGNDEVRGGEGNDRLYGGRDNDRIYGDAGNDTLIGDHGEDELYGGDGNDGFFGGGDDDRMFGEAGDDALFGDGGADTIDGGEGTNLLNGGAGDDILIHTYGVGSNTIVGSTGVDTVVLNLPSSGISDAVMADVRALQEWFSENLSNAGGDYAQLAGQTGGETLELAALGVTISNAEKLVIKVDGNEVPVDEFLNQAPEAEASVAVGIDEDVVLSGQIEAQDPDQGQALTYVLDQEPANGSVTIDAQTGAFIYTPQADFSGADAFSVVTMDPFGAAVTQEVAVSVAAIADTPKLASQDASAVLPAPAPIFGTARADVLVGDGGSAKMDVPLDISAALTDLDGSETLSILIEGLPAQATLSAGVVNNDGSVTLTSAQLEGLYVTTTGGMDFDLNVTAIASDGGVSTAVSTSTLHVSVDVGNANNDIIDGLGGNDQIDGGVGDDLIIAGNGNDSYFGGDGFDTIDYSAATQKVVIDLKDGVASGMGNDTVSGFEAVVGSGFNDRIKGDDGANVIYDGAGKDKLYGRDGDDVFVAGAGDDTYDGGKGFDTVDFSTSANAVTVDLDRGKSSGNGKDKLKKIESVIGSDFDDDLLGSDNADTLDGGAGDDVIRGGEAADTLTGGAGGDTFTWETDDLAVGTFDTISDFDVASDTLDFSNLDYLSRSGPNDADRVVLQEVNGGTLISMDMSSRSGATEVVFLEGVTGLVGSDLDGSDWLML